LLTLAVVSIAVLLLLIIKFKVEPFIALIVVALLVALAAGVPTEALVGSAQKASDSLLEKGFGGILGHIAAIIGLGTLLGAILEASGGAQVLMDKLMQAVSPA
jgi:GntP family gluconate:H+ symporter